MQRAIVFSFLLAAATVSLFADSPSTSAPGPRSVSRAPSSLLEDLVGMTRSGASVPSVLAYAKAHRSELPPEITDAELRWLSESGVSRPVVAYMAAIDVRPSASAMPMGVTDADAYRSDDAGRLSDETYGGEAEEGGGEIYTGLSSRAGEDLSASGYDAYSPWDSAYGAPYWGYPYWYSPFPTWFVVDLSHGHDHHGHGGHGDHGHGDGWHGGHGHGGDGHGGDGHGGNDQAWRSRGGGNGRGQLAGDLLRASGGSRGRVRGGEVSWRDREGPGRRGDSAGSQAGRSGRSVIGRGAPRYGGSPRVRGGVGGSAVRTRTIAPHGFSGGAPAMRGGSIASGRGFGSGPGSRGPVSAPSGSRGSVGASSGGRGRR